MGKDARKLRPEYGVAILAVVVAVLIRWLLDPWLGSYVPLATLYGAVAVAVWFGGYRTGWQMQEYVNEGPRREPA